MLTTAPKTADACASVEKYPRSIRKADPKVDMPVEGERESESEGGWSTVGIRASYLPMREAVWAAYPSTMHRYTGVVSTVRSSSDTLGTSSSLSPSSSCSPDCSGALP